MKRKFKALLIAAVLLAVFSGSASAFQRQPATVTLFDRGVFYTYDTVSMTANAMFEENNIAISPGDIVTAFVKDELGNVVELPYTHEMQIAEGMGFKIDRAAKVNISVDNQIITLQTTLQTVGELMTTLPQFNGEDYRVVHYLPSDRVYDEMLIEISRIVTNTVINLLEIPFRTETIENPELPVGSQTVIQEGIEGKIQVEAIETYLGDEKISSIVNYSQVVSEPVTQIIQIGTKVLENVVNGYVYTKTFQVTATAYTANENARTFTGIKPYEGVISVDPSVIPLGTKVYVEGYGYAIAADTGKSIKGNKIDVFYDTYKEAINYGVQSVKIYILE